MRKGIIVLIAIAVFVAFTMPAMADTVFNNASKWISTWKCPMKCESCKAAPAKTAATRPAAATATDALNNPVPTGTVK